jgi:predicted NBD/HSP70 family sugar kinase
LRRIDTERFVRATRATSRDINRRIILNLVRENQPISRADLARRMGIGRGMITSLVTELIDAGEIFSGDTVTAPRGRRPEMLFIRTRDRLVVAIDIRLSRTYLLLSDFAGREISLDSFETIVEPKALVAEIARRVDRLLDGSGMRTKCEGIGLVVPGMVDRDTARVIRAPQLGWRDVDIRDDLERAAGFPVKIENAPIACALSRMWLGGEDRAPQNFTYVTVSDGVGSAIVARGEILRGATDAAGEFGHVSIDPDGPECMCGARGCLEAYTSNLATVARFLRRDFSPSVARDLSHSSEVTIDDVIDEAASGNAHARETLARTAECLGHGLANIVNSVNPGIVFVGGEITRAWDLFDHPIQDAIRSRALTETAAATPVVPDPPDSRPRLTGATALVAASAFAAPVIA